MSQQQRTAAAAIVGACTLALGIRALRKQRQNSELQPSEFGARVKSDAAVSLPTWDFGGGVEAVVELDSIEARLLKSFDVDPVRGFLPLSDPLQRLPHEYRQWESLARDMTKLLCAGRFKSAVTQLPVLDATRLTGDSELRRAFLLLSMFTQSYVWGQTPAADHLPNSIAIPLLVVSEALDVPLVLCHMSIVLYNWRRLDPEGPLDVSNLATLHQFLGSSDESWFYLLTVEIEWRGAKALLPLLRAQSIAEAFAATTAAVLDGNTAKQAPSSGEEGAAVEEMTALLAQAAIAVKAVVKTMARMPEGCAPFVFYHRVRPFLSGWKGNPTLPDGLLFGDRSVLERGGNDGGNVGGGEDSDVDAARWLQLPRLGQRLQFHGGSAAQSSLMPALDALLGVHHGHAVSSPFLREMEAYMPRKHRAFLQHLRNTCQGPGSLHSFVSARVTAHPRLAAAFNDCVKGLESFRGLHMRIVRRYIIQQQSGAGGNEVADERGAHSVDRDTASAPPPHHHNDGRGGGGGGSGTTTTTKGLGAAAGGKGTGGSDLMTFLVPVCEETRSARVIPSS